MKRTLDFSFALAALILLSPLFVIIGVAIWTEDLGSPLFLGSRVGRNGAIFRMAKFRTMRPDAWKTGVNSTNSGDKRITRVGRWLRRAKLDELPQFWNVFRGDMSLVGPRPQVPCDAALYTADEQRMLSLRPGITDFASIVFADEGDILAGDDNPDLLYNQIIRPWKSRLALLYVEHASFALNLRILMLTVVALVSRRRAIDGVERTLRACNADPLLLFMASRHEPLIAYPPPGSVDIVEHYPSAQIRIVNI